MRKILLDSGQLFTFRHLLKWTLLSIPLAALTGSLVAFFLWMLDLVTIFRHDNAWIIYFLPAGGILIYLAYKYAGKNAESGNNLIMDEIHERGEGVPLRMTPLVLFSTLLTHLLGGSAGREGTAVQMGGSLAGFLAKIFRLTDTDR